jgi:hypothetical protein
MKVEDAIATTEQLISVRLSAIQRTIFTKARYARSAVINWLINAM